MTMTLNSLALAVSDSLALSILLKVTITTSLALVAVRLLRRSRAAVRHVLLTAAFALLVIVPLAALVAPALRVEVPASAAVAALAAPPPASSFTETEVITTREADQGPAPSSALATISWSTLALVVWIGGAFVTMLPVVVGLWQVRRVRRTGLPWAHGQAIAAALTSGRRLRRVVDVQLHESVDGPMTSGVMRPAVILPLDAPAWSPADVSRAMSHELEHVSRADWLSQCLARVVCAAYWFHPLVWVARERLALEAERACDDAVLQKSELSANAGSEPTAYADQLVDLAARVQYNSGHRLLAMASRTDLATRIRAVLDEHQPRGRAGAVAVVAASAVAILIAMTVSPLRVVAAQTSTKKLRFDVAAIRECGPDSPLPPGGGGRGSGGGNVTSSTGHVMIECATVQLLVRKAYNDAPKIAAGQDIGEFNNMNGPSAGDHPMVRGIPDWAKSVRYQIEATAPPDADRLTMVGPMLQTLLEERFKLTYHWETEDIPVYALTVAKSGLKIEPQACVPYDPAAPRPDGSPASFSIDVPASQLDLSKAPCGLTQRGHDRFMMTGTTLSNFAWGVSASLDKPMVDKTGITDKFNILLRLDPSAPQVAGVRPPPTDPAVILRALEEQIGLKIESAKAPLRYIKIDQIQKPNGPRQ